MRLHCIYALSDPRTQEVRYVGKTSIALCTRVARHLQPRYLLPNTYKNRWLRQLIACGEWPVADIIETCDTPAQQNDAEKFWISYWKFIGARLTNATEGGEGQSPGYITSPETKIKISARLKGRIPTPEQRQRSSVALRDRRPSKATRQKMSTARKGLPVSADARARMSRSRFFPGVIDENGTVYPTTVTAASALKISRTTVWRLLYGHLESANGHTLQFRR